MPRILKSFSIRKGLGGVQGRAGRNQMIASGRNIAEVIAFQRHGSEQGGQEAPLPILAEFFPPGEGIQFVRVTFDRRIAGATDKSHWRYFHIDGKEKVIADDLNFVIALGDFAIEFTFGLDLGPTGLPHVEYRPGTFQAFPTANVTPPLADELTGARVIPFSIPVEGLT